jgi:hypothetical protein
VEQRRANALCDMVAGEIGADPCITGWLYTCRPTKNGPNKQFELSRASQSSLGRGAMEKAWALPTWKTLRAFPTFPWLRRLLDKL